MTTRGNFAVVFTMNALRVRQVRALLGTGRRIISAIKREIILRPVLALLLGCGGLVAGITGTSTAAEPPRETTLTPAARSKTLDEWDRLKRQAAALCTQGDYAKAAPLVLKAQELCKLLFGENSPEYAAALLPGARKLISVPGRFSWSPDRTKVVGLQPPPRSGLQILDIRSGARMDLLPFGKDPVWSAATNRIAFVREMPGKGPDGEEIWIVGTDGGNPRKLGDGGFPSWSSDGKTIFFHSRKEKQIMAVEPDVTGGAPRELFAMPWHYFPAVAPDGKRIAFLKDGRLIVMDREAGTVLATCSLPGWKGALLGWSPDGKYLALGSYGYANRVGLWILDLAKGQLFLAACGPCTLASWSADGSKFAWCYRDAGREEVWAVEANAAELPAASETWAPLERIARPTNVKPPALLSGKLDPQDRRQFYEALQAELEIDQLIAAHQTAKAVAGLRKIVESKQRVFGPDDLELAASLEKLVALYEFMGEYAKAEPPCRQAYDIFRKALGEMHPNYARRLINLGELYKAMREYAKAEPLLCQAVQIEKHVLGENHPDHAVGLRCLALLYQQQGDYGRAEPLFREAAEIWKKLLGENNPRYASSLENLAIVYQFQGDYRRAEPLFLQACSIRKKVLGEHDPVYAAGLNNLGLLYQLQGDFPRAESLLRQALEIKKKALGENQPDYAGTLHNLANLYKTQGDYPRAELLCRQALEIRRKALGESHVDYAESLSTLAGLYQAQGDYPRVEPLLRQALEIKKKALGENHPAYAESLGSLAGLYRDQGDYPRAEPLYDQALEINRKTLGKKHPGYAASLYNLARLYLDEGDYARAEPLYWQALEINRKARGENHPAYTASLNNLAVLYQRQGEYSRAEPFFRQALEIDRKVLGENHPEYATNLMALGGLYQDQGDYARAEPFCRQALEIRKKALGENHPDYASSLDNLASLYQAQADYRRAELLQRRALEICKKALGEDHAYYANCLNNLASVYMAQKDYERAEPLCRQALAIRKKILGENHPQYASSLNNLAGLYQDQGDYAQAEPLQCRSVEICKKILGENHPQYAGSLSNLAGLYQAQGDYRRAEPLRRQALEIDKKAFGENHPKYAASLRNLAGLFLIQGDYRRSEPLYGQAAAVIRRQLEATAMIQSERQQLAMLQDNRLYLDLYLNPAVDGGQHVEAAYRELLAWKGMVVRRNRLARAAAQSPELATTFTRLQRVATQLTRLAWAAPDPRQEANWRERVAKLSVAKEQLEAELSARSAEYRQAKRAVPLEDLQAALSQDSVLLDFVEYRHYRPADEKSGTKTTSERRLLAFVVAPGRPVEMAPLGATQPINEAIEAWRATYGMAAEGAKAARLLRERLWTPLEEKLHGAKIVLISPDGALSRLPFGALPGKTPGSYLIEERTFAVVPVPQLIPQLVQEEGRKQLRKKLLLLGNVDYDAPPDKGRIGSQPVSKDSSKENGDSHPAGSAKSPSRSVPPGALHFGPLPGTESEIAAIEELCRRAVGTEEVTALRKSHAGKEAFLAEAGRHGYLHLATHGFFIEEHVRAAAFGSREASQPGEMFHRPEAGGTYPALLSGLALAGANQAGKADADEPTNGNEGILTAEEIGTQNLDGVQIVVLSACESGLGKQASGEGLLGLQRSFQSAGAERRGQPLERG